MFSRQFFSLKTFITNQYKYNLLFKTLNNLNFSTTNFPKFYCSSAMSDILFRQVTFEYIFQFKKYFLKNFKAQSLYKFSVQVVMFHVNP